MRYCEKCGKELQNDAKFCSNCGAVVNNSSFRNDCDVELTISVKVNGPIASKTDNYVFIPHLGKTITVSVPNFIQEKQSIRLRGLGKEKNGQKGDLYLKISKVEHLQENAYENEYTNHQTNRKEEWAGKIMKCPSCGENIPSFTAVCPTCGHEFRGTNSTNSVKELATKLEKATTDTRRADLIRTFPIPNTREDILEFMILASTNIENSFQADISEAWSVKFEQAYEKSKVLYGELPEFTRCYELFLKKKKENNKVIKLKERQLSRKEKALERKQDSISRKAQSEKRRERSSRFFEKNKEWILIVAGFLAIFIIIGSMGIPHKIKEYKLERLIDQVEEYIASGDFETARIKANQIIDDSDWSSESEKKYDEIRNSLLEMIDQKEVAVGSKIYIGASSKDFKGQNYLDVVSQLQDKGFNNIQTEPIEDLITGWLTGDGEIEKITIDGRSDFTEKSVFAKDAEIVITYHTFKSK